MKIHESENACMTLYKMISNCLERVPQKRSERQSESSLQIMRVGAMEKFES